MHGRGARTRLTFKVTVPARDSLPVGSFYHRDGSRREAGLARKRDSLQLPVHPIDGRLPAAVAFHAVIPEALAAWYDQVITEADGGVQLAAERLQVPVAVVDIGGRTTDYVVVADQALPHAASGSLRCGLLEVQRAFTEVIRRRFDLEVVSERAVAAAIDRGRVRLFGQDHDIADLLKAAQRQLVEQLHAETQRLLGRGAELERILFVGGGAVALAAHIRDWFPNQAVADHPAFANASGMLKYLRYVCEVPHGP